MLLVKEESKLRNEEARDIYRLVNEGKAVVIKEMCDCYPHQIRHNNGGNYHAILSIVRKNGRYYLEHSNTCELHMDWVMWEKVSHDRMIEEINKFIEQYEIRMHTVNDKWRWMDQIEDDMKKVVGMNRMNDDFAGY